MSEGTYPFSVPNLRFGYDAFEPYIDAETMRLHRDRHHQAYVDNLNAVLEDQSALHGMSIEDILRDLDRAPEGVRQSVRDYGGGHANHQFLWKIMRPGPAGSPSGQLADAIDSAFGSFAGFKRRFEQIGASFFGSGWVFLVADPRASYAVKIHTTPNQNSVLPERLPALMGCDLWEHAYYLNHQDRRADYLTGWWNVVDWEVCTRRYEGVLAGKRHL